MIGQFQHIDGEFDIHIAFDAAAAGGVGKFLGGLGDQGIAVIGEPIGQRLQRRILFGFQYRRIVIGANDMRLFTKEFEQVTVIDIETEVA